MSDFVIEGGTKLCGEIDIQGAKNSCLPILAATLIDKNVSVIHNCPDLTDVNTAVKILEYLGCEVIRENHTVIVDATCVTACDIPEHLMCEMRCSVVFLGAIIARCHKARISMPGGCELGPRPIDLHLDGLKKLGVTIKDEHGYLDCRVDKGLKGNKISLAFPSVGATENIMIASTLAKGTTTIYNAAQEPEIVDLANFLNKKGAKIYGAGENIIVIEGTNTLSDSIHSIIPDRIVTATYLSSAAITGGEVLLKKVCPDDLSSVIPILEEAGCFVKGYDSSIYLKAPDILKPVSLIRTMPYPGFPTDAQAPIMALLCVANGTSIFVENIFENRYKHVCELNKMGADIKLEGKVAVVKGVSELYGTSVAAKDLRGGASLIVAALKAKGITRLKDIYHIDRGYDNIEIYLSQLNAKIIRTK